MSPEGVFLIAADHLMAKDVAAAARSKLRRHLEAELLRKSIKFMGVVTVPETVVPHRVDLSDVPAQSADVSGSSKRPSSP